MAKVVQLRDREPELRIFVATDGELNLGNVSRFLQRLDTGARRVARSRDVFDPSLQIVSLTTGSLDLKIKLESRRVGRAGLAIGAASLAIGLAQYLTHDPPAARAARDLIVGDNATVINVEGGGEQHQIRAEDLEAADEETYAAARSPAVEVLTGPQAGFVRHFGGESWVELDSRPGLIIRIRDEREEDWEPLEENARYRLDGEAHIARAGESSFFLLHDAFLLR